MLRNKRCQKGCDDQHNKNKARWKRIAKAMGYLGILFGGLYVRSILAATDDLSGLSASMKSDFGSGSTFIHILYLIEVLTALYAYTKTKNIAVLGGIVVISLFVNFAFGHWVFPT